MAAITATAANAAPLIGAVTKDGVAGATVNVLAPVYLDANGAWVHADSDAAATATAWGIVIATHDGESSAIAGDAITVALFGPIAGFSGMVEGAFGYVSATPGEMDDGAGTVTWRMGYALRADEFFVLPGVGAPTS
jgi:hypothetical protein